MKHQHIEMLISLWKKPYGKPIVVFVLLLIFFLIFDYVYLMGANVHYASHPFNSPIQFNVDTPDQNYRVAIFIGNKKSKYTLQCQLFDPDGDLLMEEEDLYSRNKRSFLFTPEQTGTYRLQVQTVYGSSPPSIMVSVYKNNRSILSHRFR